ADEGCPPSGYPIFWRNREDFTPKLNILLCAGYAFPVLVNRGTTAKRFIKRSDLICGIFGVQRGSTLGIAADPGAAVSCEPLPEGFSIHTPDVAMFSVRYQTCFRMIVEKSP